MNKKVWKTILEVLVAAITALLTSLGVTSCTI